MTIPEIEEALHAAHEMIIETQDQNRRLEENVNELRHQLGLPECPRPVSPPVSTFGKPAPSSGMATSLASGYRR